MTLKPRILVALALLILVAAGVRNHDPSEAALLGALLVAALLVGRALGNDFRAHPANFPLPIATTSVRMTVTRDDGRAHRGTREGGI